MAWLASAAPMLIAVWAPLSSRTRRPRQRRPGAQLLWIELGFLESEDVALGMVCAGCATGRPAASCAEPLCAPADAPAASETACRHYPRPVSGSPKDGQAVRAGAFGVEVRDKRGGGSGRVGGCGVAVCGLSDV